MVQSHEGFRLPDARRGDRGHFHPHGNLAPFRPHRASSGTGGPGPLRAGRKGFDGGGNPSRLADPRQQAALMTAIRNFFRSAVLALFFLHVFASSGVQTSYAAEAIKFASE